MVELDWDLKYFASFWKIYGRKAPNLWSYLFLLMIMASFVELGGGMSRTMEVNGETENVLYLIYGNFLFMGWFIGGFVLIALYEAIDRNWFKL